MALSPEARATYKAMLLHVFAVEHEIPLDMVALVDRLTEKRDRAKVPSS